MRRNVYGAHDSVANMQYVVCRVYVHTYIERDGEAFASADRVPMSSRPH